MSNTLVLDIECSTFQKGNPYSKANKLVAIGVKFNDNTTETFYGNYDKIKDYLKLADVIIGFNLKFDLAWLTREGLYDPIRSTHKFWDCQLVDFILERQATPYPSLDGCCTKYGLGSKLDTVSTEYWAKGIDTPDIPRPILDMYLIQDIELTYRLCQHQQSLVPDTMKRLISLSNQDLGVLLQMEVNGLDLDTNSCSIEADSLEIEIEELEEDIKKELNVTSFVNLSSNDHLSVLLYGGEIAYDRTVQTGFYKTGMRKGEPKYKKAVYKVPYPRLIVPLKGSELAKKGYWSTDAPTLASVKCDKEMRSVINLLTKYSELKKLTTTYLRSLPELITAMDWEPNTLHGQFNQCVARTGRLSSSRPNLQNLPKEVKLFIRSRYE